MTTYRQSYAGDPAEVPLLNVVGLTKDYEAPWGNAASRRALDGIEICLEAGEALSLVGESGSGKTTAAKIIAGLMAPTKGTVEIDGTSLAGLRRRQMREVFRTVQMVFQDPYSSLDPRMKVGSILTEPLKVQRIGTREYRRRRAVELLEMVGMSAVDLTRRPRAFSGGQRQRIAIARALAFKPRLLVLDEPVSALDVSIQGQVVNLLNDLRFELGLAYLFITHDLSLVRHMSTRVSVMYKGRIVETGRVEAVFSDPQHPYTRALLSAIPGGAMVNGSRPKRIVLPATADIDNEHGCSFRDRCWLADTRCAEEAPHLRRVADGTLAACHHAD